MAISFAGGTDTVRYTQAWPFAGSPSIGCAAFRMKTTTTTVNLAVVTLYNSSGRLGWEFLMNLTAGKIKAACIDVSNPAKIDIDSTTSVNDGNWHSAALNWHGTTGQPNTLFIDGVQEATANATGDWSISGLSIPLALGDSNDSFWTSYPGEIADLAIWSGRQLTADEHAAYGKGISPKLIAPANLRFYAPLIRSVEDSRGAGATVSQVGTTVSDHPRVTG